MTASGTDFLEQVEIVGHAHSFFNIKGVIMIEWVHLGKMANQKYCIEILTKLREKVKMERSDLWNNNSWILHQDNEPEHSVLSVKPFLADKHITVFGHLLYSPDIAPCNFFIFPKVKCALKGTYSQSVDEVKAKTANLLKRVALNDLQLFFGQ